MNVEHINPFNEAEGQKANVIEAVDAGVTNYIIKPFNTDTIKEKLSKVFK